jgi:flavin-dependent dehydrogenase
MIQIKVAIIGAGLSGLACAFEFKKNGCTPVIFEKQSQIGEILDFSGIWLRMFTRHFCDPKDHFKKEYGLDIQPLNKLNELVMKFPNKEVRVKGKLGYILERSTDKCSLENQLVQQANISIQFDSEVKLEEIKNNFDYVVVACGDHRPAEKLGICTNIFSTYSRVTRIAGDFKPDLCKLWINTEYANHSFCYLIPKSPSVATLAQILNVIPQDQYDLYWDKFFTMEGQKYEILEKKDTTHYSGFVHPIRVDNIFFVGSAAGLTDDLIGIGAYNAIISGIWAARSIIGKLDYNAIMRPYGNDITKMHEFRKAVNTFNNKDFDMVASLIGAPLIKQFIYKNPLFKIRHATSLARLYNYFNQKN